MFSGQQNMVNEAVVHVLPTSNVDKYKLSFFYTQLYLV